jgi:iron(III) transport system ATP-binding protein
MPDLVVENVAKRFGASKALNDVSFTVKDGEFFTLLGPSGCGKSTTLNCVAGLELPDEGTIRVGDEVFVDASRKKFLTPEERNLGMVFQSYALWPHMTVTDNLAMPLKIRKVGAGERRRRIEDALSQVGLEAYGKRYPHELSGGQQQRVALARALVYSPRVLLLDEPLSNLDAKLRDRARAWLKDLQKTVGITTVYVTHDQLEAMSLSDRLTVMQDGKMLQIGPPKDIYDAPESAAVADFIGRCTFFPGVVEGLEGDRAVVSLEGHPVTVRANEHCVPSAKVLVGVRSERMQVRSARDGTGQGNAIPAELLKVSYVGARYECELMAAGRLAFAESDTEPAHSGPVALVIPTDGAYVFPQTELDAIEDAGERSEFEDLRLEGSA